MTGYKTAIFAVGVAVVGALQGLDWASLIPTDPRVVGWVVSGLGIAAFILRWFTTTPIGSKTP
jgi:hypothetical protein